MRRVTTLALAFAIAMAPAVLAHADSVPFTDPSAVGKLTLCDTTGHVKRSGNIFGKPFVWRAVGSAAAPAPYNGPGRTATLYAYQPIQNVDPGQWNGEYLTGSGAYTNSKLPMAPATAADPTLADYLSDYPTKWDGLVQLRMFVGVPGASTRTTPYNAAVIRVNGDTWTLVEGGTTGCGSGTSSSDELVLPSVASMGTPAPNATEAVKPSLPPQAGPTASSGASSGANGAASNAPSTTSSGTSSTSSRPDEGSSATPWIVAAAVAVLLAGGFVWYRMRPPDTGP